jgi:hypothetical protein
MQQINLFNKIQVSRWLWSALYFALTFTILNYSSHFWSAFNSWQIGFSPSFSYNGMDRILPSTAWSAKRIAFVYLAPSFWGLFSSAVGFIGFTKTDGLRTHLRTLFFWLFFNGFLLYFSYLVTGILSGIDYASDFFTGFAGFYTWLEWPKSTILGIIMFQIITGLAFSLVFPPLILKLNHSRKINSQRSGKWMVLMNVFIIPMLLGSILVLVATYPMSLSYQLVRILSCLPILGVCILAFKHVKYSGITFAKGGLSHRPYWQLAMATLLLIVLCRFLFSISITPGAS